MTDAVASFNTQRPPLGHSLKVQIRILNALVLREMLTRYGRNNLGFLWMFIEPVVFTIAVSFVWTVIRNKGAMIHISVPAFALTGYCAILLVRNITNRCNAAVAPNQTLLHHRNVRVADLYYSRIILEVMGLSSTMIILTIGFVYLGLCDVPRYPMLCIQAWFLLVWFSAGLGLCVGGIGVLSDTFSRIWRVFMYIYFPLSGAIFLVDWLPGSIHEYILWVPTVHGTELLRHGFYGDVITTYEDPGYLFKVNILVTLIGLSFIRITDQRVLAS